MTTTHATKEPVTLEGFQAIMKIGKFGNYKLQALIEDDELLKNLESERENLLKRRQSRLKNPKRSILKPEPWEEVNTGTYMFKFSWLDKNKPVIVDTEGTLITDTEIPLYSGSKVKLGFYQYDYELPDNSYGTTVKLASIQVVSVGNKAGVDRGDMSPEDAAKLFGTCTGYKAGEPNVEAAGTPSSVEDDDF
tara:strand:- start:470 stop:1045 length:576 start_codon:yes stop_codon:yes gene_type:complete